ARRDGYPCGQRTAICVACRATRIVKRAQTPMLARELFPSRWLRDRLGRSGDVVRPFAEVKAPAPTRPPAGFTALYIGRLTPSKGVTVLLDAVARAGVALVVAGDGPLESAVRASQGVTFVGYADDERRAGLPAGAGGVVGPSGGPEGAPLVFFEAVAAGVPTILADIGGLTELAELGSSVLVPPGDAQALADALTALASDPARLGELRRAALAHREEISPERFRS